MRKDPAEISWADAGRFVDGKAANGLQKGEGIMSMAKQLGIGTKKHYSILTPTDVSPKNSTKNFDTNCPEMIRQLGLPWFRGHSI